MPSPIESCVFGTLPDGTVVDRYGLRNRHGLEAAILTLGGIVQEIRLPDASSTSIVLGFDDLGSYLADPDYCGAIVGRFANRIADGKLSVDGRAFSLSRNEGRHTLHGGAKGFDKAVWTARIDGDGLVLTHVSPDGDQGFPGTLVTNAAYRLDDDGTLCLEFQATCDAPTVVNLTQHMYWNLSGGNSTMLDHTLEIDAAHYLPVDAEGIPTGEIRPVAGTRFDLRAPTPLASSIAAFQDEQIALAGGLDHTFVLSPRAPPVRAATLAHPASGRSLTVHTTEPGLHVYSANAMKARRAWAPDMHWKWIALETQHFPNAPNVPSFPSTLLRPGEAFRSSTRFHVSWTQT